MPTASSSDGREVVKVILKDWKAPRIVVGGEVGLSVDVKTLTARGQLNDDRSSAGGSG